MWKLASEAVLPRSHLFRSIPLDSPYLGLVCVIARNRGQIRSDFGIRANADNFGLQLQNRQAMKGRVSHLDLLVGVED